MEVAHEALLREWVRLRRWVEAAREDVKVHRTNYERLVEVKRKYDPDNLFHLNQNIRA